MGLRRGGTDRCSAPTRSRSRIARPARSAPTSPRTAPRSTRRASLAASPTSSSACGVPHLRAHARPPASRPAASTTAVGAVTRRGRRARHRGLHRRAAGLRSATSLPDVLADDRHRTAARRRPGRRSAGASDETFNDERHLHRLRDSAPPTTGIAIGGRGAPYHCGSRVSDGLRPRRRTCFEALAARPRRALPADRPRVAVTHTWGGPLGIPRDWYSSVGLRPRHRASPGPAATSATASARRTSPAAPCADLILGHDTELTALPWVGHQSPLWEPEPLRWLAVNAAMKAMASADSYEERTGKPSKRATMVKKLIGA